MLRLQPLEIDPLTWAAETAHARQRWFALSSAVALTLHAVAGWVVPRSSPHALTFETPATEVFDIEAPETPPPLPPPPSESPPETPPPRARAALVAAARPVAAAPPPAAAGAVLTASDDAPLDLTNTFVTGSSTSYQGGSTSRALAVTRATAAPRGSELGDGSNDRGAPVGVDRSRPATLAGSASWSCPFPQQADLEGVHHASSLLIVVVDTAGRASSVTVLHDPGYGFGAAARACALRRRYNAALDRSGAPVATTLVLNVRFDR